VGGTLGGQLTKTPTLGKMHEGDFMPIPPVMRRAALKESPAQPANQEHRV
jgi:hypothetical protein